MLGAVLLSYPKEKLALVEEEHLILLLSLGSADK
jgi:hypothetical protein